MRKQKNVAHPSLVQQNTIFVHPVSPQEKRNDKDDFDSAAFYLLSASRQLSTLKRPKTLGKNSRDAQRRKAVWQAIRLNTLFASQVKRLIKEKRIHWGRNRASLRRALEEYKKATLNRREAHERFEKRLDELGLRPQKAEYPRQYSLEDLKKIERRFQVEQECIPSAVKEKSRKAFEKFSERVHEIQKQLGPNDISSLRLQCEFPYQWDPYIERYILFGWPWDPQDASAPRERHFLENGVQKLFIEKFPDTTTSQMIALERSHKRVKLHRLFRGSEWKGKRGYASTETLRREVLNLIDKGKNRKKIIESMKEKHPEIVDENYFPKLYQRIKKGQ